MPKRDQQPKSGDQSLRVVEKKMRMEAQGYLQSKLREIQTSRDFEHKKDLTEQLRSLRDAQPRKLCLSKSIGTEEPEIVRYDVTMYGKKFLRNSYKLGACYARSGYKELYDKVYAAWKGTDNRVCIRGGIEKDMDWFQVYALKQLMDNQERDYDFVVQQLCKMFFFVYDLATANVYYWSTTIQKINELSQSLERTLFFFETDSITPTNQILVMLPSLAGMSSNDEWMQHYPKEALTCFYFWPWSFSEMWAAIEDAPATDCQFDEFVEKYQWCGGQFEVLYSNGSYNVAWHLRDIDTDALSDVRLDIDGVEGGTYGDRLVVCYDNRCIDTADCFSTKQIEFASRSVEGIVAKKLRGMSMGKRMKQVLVRMDGEEATLDLSGKVLEQVARQLLSEGWNYNWLCCDVGAAVTSWQAFRATTKLVKHTDVIGSTVVEPDLIIAPHKTTFPVVDFLYSQPHSHEPVIGFLCTWKCSHRFSVRSLYDLRFEHLHMEEKRELHIYVVSPGNEGAYVHKQKRDFLIGSLDADMMFSDQVNVPAATLRAMWEYTKIFVMRPEESWQRSITAWMSGDSVRSSDGATSSSENASSSESSSGSL